MFWTWFWTVRCESTSRSAICLYDIPLATIRSTSVSRSVSVGWSGSVVAGSERRRYSPSTSPASPGVKTVSPFATRRTASSSSLREADFTR